MLRLFSSQRSVDRKTVLTAWVFISRSQCTTNISHRRKQCRIINNHISPHRYSAPIFFVSLHQSFIFHRVWGFSGESMHLNPQAIWKTTNNSIIIFDWVLHPKYLRAFSSPWRNFVNNATENNKRRKYFENHRLHSSFASNIWLCLQDTGFVNHDAIREGFKGRRVLMEAKDCNESRNKQN